MAKYELCSILLKWLQTFNIDGPRESIKDICDGVAIANALHEIAPEWFSNMWRSKIKTDIGDNWRLKVSNLKKLIQGIIDYYQEYFNQHLPEFVRPDAGKIGEHCDTEELAKLLQLVLNCAINCNRKQEYIQNIMLLEESVQSVIMQSIQELEHSLGSSPLSFGAASLNADAAESQMQQMMADLQLLRDSNEQLNQKCQSLNAQLSMLQEENSTLSKQKRYYEQRWQEMLDDPVKDNILRKQMEALKDELFKVETSRDDYRLKLELQEKELSELQAKFDVLQQTVAEARNLKDEVDILRENADKVENLERIVQAYKKKLEDMTELKREMKLLESKNSSYLQQVMELEEELKKANTWKCQVDVYKKQMAELRNNLNEETKKVDKMEFEHTKVREKLNALQKEKERIIAERDSLKEANEELICLKLQSKEHDDANAADIMSPSSSGDKQKVSLISEGIISKMELKQELTRLQRENSLLKNNQKDEKSPVLQEIIDDIGQQNKQLQHENRLANQRILELEEKLKEYNSNGGDETKALSSSSSSSRLKELQNQLQFEGSQRSTNEIAEKDRMLTEQKQVISIMEDTIMEKEHEIQDLEDRYKKYLEKAKYIAKSFGSSSPILSSSRQEMQEVIEKHYDEPTTADRLMKDADEKQSSSCTFYNLSAQKKQRELAEQKLNSSVGGHMPFLARQRQSALRRVPF